MQNLSNSNQGNSPIPNTPQQLPAESRPPEIPQVPPAPDQRSNVIPPPTPAPSLQTPQPANGSTANLPAPSDAVWKAEHLPPGLDSVFNFPKDEVWPDPVDGVLLLDDLARLTSRFLVLPKWSPETLALWVIHTFAFELRDVTTYLGVESPIRRCGKSTLIAVLSRLANRPVVASNISSPAFFRAIEEFRPTLFIDEADTILRGNNELRGILNSGYHSSNAFVVRVANEFANADLPASVGAPVTSTLPAERGTRLVRFSCWCPKVIAAIGHLPDTLADRCILIRMQRKLPSQKCERIRDLDGQSLRRQCARFVLDHAQQIASARPDIPAALNDRAADIWEPLFAIADLAGGHWPDLARQAAVGLAAAAEENSPISALLFDIFVLFTLNKADRLFSRDIVLHLNSYADRPWSDLRKGRPLTERWLARHLTEYDIFSRSIRLGDTVCRGYLFDDFLPAFRRYMSKSEIDSIKTDCAPAAIPDQPPGQSPPA